MVVKLKSVGQVIRNKAQRWERVVWLIPVLKSDLKQKYKLCIISGAIDVFVDVISRKLGIYDRYTSTKFIFDNNEILMDFNYKLSRGEEKVGFFHDFCTKNNLAPEECVAIGDGDSDMPIFGEVGFPVLFIAKETTEDLRKTVERQISKWSEIYKYL